MCPLTIRQNALIYPALGLGAIVSKSRTLSPGMFAAGVQALASLSPALKDPEASLLPDLSEVRDVSLHVAAAVAKRSVEEGHSRVPALAGMSMEQIEERIKSSTWCVTASIVPCKTTKLTSPRHHSSSGTLSTGRSSWSTSSDLPPALGKSYICRTASS